MRNVIFRFFFTRLGKGRGNWNWVPVIFLPARPASQTHDSDKGRMILRLSVKALAGPCRSEPTIVTEVGLRRITIFGTGFYNLIK